MGICALFRWKDNIQQRLDVIEREVDWLKRDRGNQSLESDERYVLRLDDTDGLTIGDLFYIRESIDAQEDSFYPSLFPEGEPMGIRCDDGDADRWMAIRVIPGIYDVIVRRTERGEIDGLTINLFERGC